MKENAPDLMGDTDVEAQRLPKGNKTSKCDFSSCKIYRGNSLRQCRSMGLFMINRPPGTTEYKKKMKFQAQERWDLIIKIHVEMLLSHLIFLTTLSLLGSQGGYTTGKGRVHPWMSFQFIHTYCFPAA